MHITFHREEDGALPLRRDTPETEAKDLKGSEDLELVLQMPDLGLHGVEEALELESQVADLGLHAVLRPIPKENLQSGDGEELIPYEFPKEFEADLLLEPRDLQTRLLGTEPSLNICVLELESRNEVTGTEGEKSRRDDLRMKSSGKPARGKTTGTENSVIRERAEVHWIRNHDFRMKSGGKPNRGKTTGVENSVTFVRAEVYWIQNENG